MKKFTMALSFLQIANIIVHDQVTARGLRIYWRKMETAVKEETRLALRSSQNEAWATKSQKYVSQLRLASHLF